MQKLLFLLITFPVIAFTQKAQQEYAFPNSVPGKYFIDPIADYQQIRQIKVPGHSQGPIDRFAESVAFTKSELFSLGNVYFGLDAFENYLNQILHKIIPDDFPGKNEARVYVGRSPEFNAFALYDGTILVNVGCLAEITSEAALAAILAHEFAHFYFKDLLNGYFNNLSSAAKKNRTSNIYLHVKKAHESKTAEKRADSLAFELMVKAGYSLKGIESSFFSMLNFEKEDEEINKATSPKKLVNVGKEEDKTEKNEAEAAKTMLLSSHPETANRLHELNKFIASKENYSGKEYLVDSLLLAELKEFSRNESFLLLLETNQLYNCARLSFKSILLGSNPNIAFYYLCESLRRKIYLDPSDRKKQFLSDPFSYAIKKKKEYFKELYFFFPDSLQRKKAKESPWYTLFKDSVENYDDAFRHFSELIDENETPEIMLVKALFAIKKKEISTNLIKKYINHPDAARKDYANWILSDMQPLANGSEKKDILLNEFLLVEDHIYGYHIQKVNALEQTLNYKNELETFLKKKKNGGSFATQLKYYRLNISLLHLLSNYKEHYFVPELTLNDDLDTSRLNGKNIFLFDPEVWKLFSENPTREISFVNFVSFTDETRHGLSKYKHIFLTRITRLNHAGYLESFYGNVTNYKFSKSNFLNEVWYGLN
jgi:hypothetical protein